MLNKNLPLVSVFIPAYNHEKYIAESIQSVIDQTYVNLELIVVNDGSKDGTDEIIKRFEDKCRTRFSRFEYRNRENRGLSETLNEALEWSRGKYFTGIASDDVMLSNKVAVLVNALEKESSAYGIAFGDASFINENGKKMYISTDNRLPSDSGSGTNSFLEYETKKRQIEYKNKDIFGLYEIILDGNYLPGMSYVVKTDMLEKVGGWTINNTIEDWEMWLKLSKTTKFLYVDKVVAKYRVHNFNSMKIIGRKICYDSLNILKREREFAYGLNKQDIYWDTVVRHISGLLRYNKAYFLLEFFKNIFNFIFLKKFFHRVFKKIKRMVLECVFWK